MVPFPVHPRSTRATFIICSLLTPKNSVTDKLRNKKLKKKNTKDSESSRRVLGLCHGSNGLDTSLTFPPSAPEQEDTKRKTLMV